jgi:PAS domain S-box-containing protein
MESAVHELRSLHPEPPMYAGETVASAGTGAAGAQSASQPDDAVTTGFMVFDERDRLLELNAELFETVPASLSALNGKSTAQIVKLMLPDLKSFAGEPVSSTRFVVNEVVRRWSAAHGSPIEVETNGGRWKLFTTHPRPGGGTAYISVDITEFKQAQLTLRENEELFRCITETHPLPVWMADAETGEILYESVSASQILGREYDREGSQNILEYYVDPSDRDGIKQQLADNAGFLQDYEMRLCRADGTQIWISATVRAGIFHGRDVLIAGVHDLTERKQKECELEQARALLRDAIESLSEGFALYDADQRLVLCNARYREFHNSHADALEPGITWRDLMRSAIAHGQYPDAVGREEEWLDEHDAMRLQFGTKHQYESACGRWMESVSTRTSLGGFVITRADITERKHLEQAQAEREEQLRFVIENHPLPVWMNDAHSGEVLYESRAAAAAFGREWDPSQPKFMQDYCVHESDSASFRRRLRQEGTLEDYEVLLQRADGTPFWAIGNAKWTEYQGREVLLAGIVDVTRRKEQEEYFRLLIEDHPLPVTLTEESSGQIIYESPEAATLFGRAWKPGSPGCIGDLYADAKERDAFVSELRKADEIRDFQVRLKRVDGEPFWAVLNARRVDYQGRSVILTGLSDQTERVEREGELMRARELVNDAIESLSEGFALYDADDRLVMCNTRYREMHYLCADALTPGVRWLDFLRVAAERGQFPNALGRMDEWLEERRLDRELYRQHHEHQHADGRWYSVSNSNTSHGGTVVTRVDVTERKKMELQERERDALVREVLDGCPVPVQMSRVDGTVIYRSPATRALFGATTTTCDYYVNPSDREPYVERLKRDGKVDDFEVQLRNADGDTFWGLVSSRIIDYDGEQVIVSNTLDLTERKAMDLELAEQRETLFQREKLSALGELLAGVAHELNNPLSVVVGQALLLKETAEDQRISERASKIGNAADRCARIVKTFLAMARQQPAELTAVDLNNIVESALDVASYTLRSSTVHVKLKLAADLPKTLADADQLNQVLINLLVNAQHALEDVSGDRRLTLSTSYDAVQDDVVLQVSDNGRGIPEALQKRIFEPFFTTKDVGSGTGIGLAFCHRIVERHGGTISVDSTDGRGATFSVRLPVRCVHGCASEMEATIAHCRSGLKVLVIDDEPDVAELISEILRSDGNDVTMCLSAVEALQRLDEIEFDAVFSDLKMPELDGPGLLEKLRETAPAVAGRLAFVTGDTMSPRAGEFLRSSGRPYVEKPIRPQELRDLLDEIVATSLEQKGSSP